MGIALMSKYISVDSTILLTPAFNDSDAFSDLIEDFIQNLPTFRPRHWGVIEPINLELNMPEIREFLRKGSSDISWQRKTPPKGWGVFHKRYYPLFGPQFARHTLDVSTNKSEQMESLIAYLHHMVTAFGVEYAFCDSLAEEYKEVGFENGLAPSARRLMIFTHKLVKNLPDIVWSQIFGPAYVKLFGLEKLLSAPAYKVEQLGPETVYIQLSESLFDMHERYDEVDVVRQQVKHHLDDNIFFDPKHPEDHTYRTPEFVFPE
jgi:hypothetical protein